MLPTPARTLLAAALAAGVLVVPVGLAAPAQAAPCLEIVPGVPLCPQPAATTPPMITGEAKVGRTLTATPPVWDQADVETTYQWLQGTAEIEGATSSTYTLTPDDLEESISVRATGTGAGPLPGTADSAAVEPVKGDTITSTSPPVVDGSPAVGGTLTVTSPGVWPGTPEPTYEYQWYRSRPSGTGAQVIAGATTTTYSPVAADAGRKLVVLVVAERIGYEKGAAISNVRTVPRAQSSTTLGLVKRTVRRSESARVRVSLGSRAGIVPTGVVTILDGGRRVRTFTVAAQSGGTVTFNLPRLARGTHRLTARYAGNTAHLPSSSGVQVLTVTR